MIPPKYVTTVYFRSEADLSEFLSSPESTAEEIRRELISRINNGERIVAEVSDVPYVNLVVSVVNDGNDSSHIPPRLSYIPL